MAASSNGMGDEFRHEEVPAQVRRAAETLHEWLGSRHHWQPLYSLLTNFVRSEPMRPAILRDLHNNLWRLFRDEDDASPLFAPPPPPLRTLAPACVYPPAGAYPLGEDGCGGGEPQNSAPGATA